MSNRWGNNFKLSIFGESHGKSIGIVLDGVPPGTQIDIKKVQAQLDRRRPGHDKTATERKESDAVEILSGVLHEKASGSPICATIQNTNTRSQDYENICTVARPSHADFVAHTKYLGNNDIRGGGHFSGRLTAPIVFAGAVAKQYLETIGITVGAHIQAIGTVEDDFFDLVEVNKAQLVELAKESFPVLDNISKTKKNVETSMRDCVESARIENDSVGGIIECAAVGIPVGFGDPFFESLESRIASLVFSVPATKGVEFGAGFKITKMRGSKANDSLYFDENNNIKTKTNNNGGVNGGISNSMPLIARIAIKPTASIGVPQNSVDYVQKKNSTIIVNGRHDPCIVLRAVPVIEAIICIALMECALGEKL